ncbi:hypothetical protein P7K49_036677 [Saguinus oedipus]|uniref:Uncharacterized protein n=1 Tax=Saguinus oedipus TaxID=9490 RepID=A0ABQ9TKT7_SAGOE|nr:hypothetical protein P7K49_036677 [Saguinus oedipus]
MERAALLLERGAATGCCDLGVKSEITFLLPLEMADDEVGREKLESGSQAWHVGSIHPTPQSPQPTPDPQTNRTVPFSSGDAGCGSSLSIRNRSIQGSVPRLSQLALSLNHQISKFCSQCTTE